MEGRRMWCRSESGVRVAWQGRARLSPYTVPMFHDYKHLSTQHINSEVDPHVLANITLCLETFLTNITLELPQASVSKHVFIKR